MNRRHHRHRWITCPAPRCGRKIARTGVRIRPVGETGFAYVGDHFGPFFVELAPGARDEGTDDPARRVLICPRGHELSYWPRVTPRGPEYHDGTTWRPSPSPDE